MINIQKIKQKHASVIVTMIVLTNLIFVSIIAWNAYKPTHYLSWGDRVSAISMAQDYYMHCEKCDGSVMQLSEFLDRCDQKKCVVAPYRPGEEVYLGTSKELAQEILDEHINISSAFKPAKPGLLGLGIGIL